MNALGGGTLLTGIFGDPVAHSLSPAMHNAAYRALGLDRAYVAFHVTPECLSQAVRSIAALGILGVNVTVPHKERITRMLDKLSAEASLLSAVNCIVNQGGRLLGDNTDARGLEQELDRLGVDLSGRIALIVGAGGGGAAAALTAKRLGARQIIIANRTVTRAAKLARRLGTKVEAVGLRALTDRRVLADSALVVNATSVGVTAGTLPSLDYEATPAECLFYDMVYADRPTAFLEPAAQLGRRTADGAGMLLYQGALAFRLFNRIDAPVEVMRAALMEKLGRPS